MKIYHLIILLFFNCWAEEASLDVVDEVSLLVFVNGVPSVYDCYLKMDIHEDGLLLDRLDFISMLKESWKEDSGLLERLVSFFEGDGDIFIPDVGITDAISYDGIDYYVSMKSFFRIEAFVWCIISDNLDDLLLHDIFSYFDNKL